MDVNKDQTVSYSNKRELAASWGGTGQRRAPITGQRGAEQQQRARGTVRLGRDCAQGRSEDWWRGVGGRHDATARVESELSGNENRCRQVSRASTRARRLHAAPPRMEAPNSCNGSQRAGEKIGLETQLQSQIRIATRIGIGDAQISPKDPPRPLPDAKRAAPAWPSAFTASTLAANSALMACSNGRSHWR